MILDPAAKAFAVRLGDGESPDDAIGRVLGSDAEEFDPLSAAVKAGTSAFLLVNHVMHRREGESEEDFRSKVADSSVVAAVAKRVADLAGGPGRLIIGNAPLQGCVHENLLEQIGLREALARRFGSSGPEIQDLRGRVSTWTRLGTKVAEEVRPASDWIEIDLGKESLLEELYRGERNPHFRVGDYPSSETERFHSPGRHIYVLNKAVLAADTIVSIPKLKTHQKVGLTGAVKGTVGAIALKECLAHHRLGSPTDGGDETSSNSYLARAASYLTEASSTGGLGRLDNALRFAAKVSYRVAQSAGHVHVGGAWAGNDTCWRMALDIARILAYARRDGSLSEVPVRRHVAVVDGLIAGEGEGPLRPTARRENLLLVATDPVAADIACALSMGWDPNLIPTISGALSLQSMPITPMTSADQLAIFGRDALLNSRCDLRGPFVPPSGWRDHLVRRA